LEVDKLKDILEANDLTVEQIKLVARIGQLPFSPNNVVIEDGTNDDPDKRALITELYKSFGWVGFRVAQDAKDGGTKRTKR
jgi:hypothetical protein